MREIAVCSPEIYASKQMQEYMQARCDDRDKQWIYRLIRGEKLENECVYVDEEEFMICLDIHPGTDNRYLVVFKDLKLRTIRDLRKEHIPLLTRVDETVREFLRTQHPGDYANFRTFFHYTPSVFQLHAHVSVYGPHNQSTRVHPLKLLLQHLRKDSLWYRDALILISLCRSMKALHVYKAIQTGKDGAHTADLGERVALSESTSQYAR